MTFVKNSKILNMEKSALLIIDLQERILPVIRNNEKLIENVLKLIKGAKILKVPIFYTEQYSKGLGPTAMSVKSELDSRPIDKNTFSCFGAENLFKILNDRKIEQIIVSGVEAHVCVQQTVLDLLENNFQVNLAVDTISSRKDIDYQTAIRRMEREGAVLSTVESVLFELLQISGTEDFKAISKIIK